MQHAAQGCMMLSADSSKLALRGFEHAWRNAHGKLTRGGTIQNYHVAVMADLAKLSCSLIHHASAKISRFLRIFLNRCDACGQVLY